MARHLYIAGKDRWRDYERGTMQIERSLTYQIDTCRFQVRGERPVEGEEVIVEDSGIGLEVVEGPQAIFTGTPTFDTGMFGKGLVVDTVAGENLEIPTAGIIDPDEGTIDIRIKLAELQDWNNFFSMSISTGRFLLFFTADGKVCWDYGPANDCISSLPGTVRAGEFVRITIRWSASQKRRQLFVNGWLMGTAAFTPPVGLPATVSVVNNYSAVIDDLRIDRIWRKDIKPNMAWCWVSNNLPVEYELATSPLPVDEHTTLKMDFEGDLKTYRSKSERFFAGIIVKVELARIQPDKSNRLWQVDCDDYTDLLDRYLVVETYENMAADAIFKDIAAKYCPGFTVNGVRSGAPIIESTGADFEYIRPSECFKWLCDYVGWHWQPDYYKDLSFFNATELSTPAPMDLKPGGRFRFGKHSIDKQGLRNRVYVRGGTMLSDPQTIEWKADGVGRIWVLPWKPHEVSLQVGEVQKTVGIENVHEEADFDYLMNFQEKYIRCSAHTATPIEGITMSLTARQDINVITMVEDLESQAAIAAIQGGDGVYEHVIVDDSLINIEAAEAAGMADLREHANPRVKGNFETEYVAAGGAHNVAVDQGWQIEQLQSDYISYYFYAEEYLGQGFIPTKEMEGAIKVQASLMSGGGFFFPVPTGWNICLDTNGKPGTSIGYKRREANDWPKTQGEWITTNIELEEPLQAYKKYWLVVQGEGFQANNQYVKYCTASDVYAGGMMVRKDGNSPWEEYPGVDVTFRIKATSIKTIQETKTWHPGQLVAINLPDRGVVGEYLIQKVTITPTFPNPSIWTYRVEYGGRLLGIADFLKALVSAQQKKQIVDTAILSKFVYGEDKISVTDEIDFAYTMEETKVEGSLETTAREFETAGSMLTVSCPYTWANPKYQTSADGSNWSTVRDIKPGEAVQVAYPGYVKLQADGEVNTYNWKKPMVETNVVCGFVVVG